MARDLTTVDDRSSFGPRPNRVTPLGDLVASPARGLVFGNRGCLHDGQGAVRRRHAGRRWIACRLEFRGRRRTPLMQPGRYTELFFLDEATAWAAGHRPCAECRRDDWNRFRALWAAEFGEDRADRVDARLHGERLDPATGRTRLHQQRYDDLPAGAFVLVGAEPCLVLADRVLAWSPEGYRPARPRPTGRGAVVPVITPPSLLAVLRAGWAPEAVPFLHPTAR